MKKYPWQSNAGSTHMADLLLLSGKRDPSDLDTMDIDAYVTAKVRSAVKYYQGSHALDCTIQSVVMSRCSCGFDSLRR